MTAFILHPNNNGLELLKWVSRRNLRVPLPLLEYLVEPQPHVPEDDNFNEDDYDDEDSWD